MSPAESDSPAFSESVSESDPGSAGGAEDQIWELKLYVAGASAKSLQAFSNLRQLCEEHLHGRYTIEIIDLVKRPMLARTDDIVAIPTLVRTLPSPIRKIIGDLSNTQRVLMSLQVGGDAT